MPESSRHNFVAVRLAILTYMKSTLRLLASRASFCLRSRRFELALRNKT